MVDRHPLIVNPTASQIQELPSGDYLYGTIPVGGIIMWSGTIASIPANWSLCNGSNGTPDLRNKFIVGANADSGGSAKTTVTGSATASGGEATKTLGTANLPSHTHTDGTLATGTPVNGGGPGGALSGTITHISETYDVSGTATGAFTKASSGNSSVTASSSTSPTAGVTFDGSHTHDITGNTGDQGGTMGQAFENLPPYFAIAYIMRTT